MCGLKEEDMGIMLRLQQSKHSIHITFVHTCRIMPQ